MPPSRGASGAAAPKRSAAGRPASSAVRAREWAIKPSPGARAAAARKASKAVRLSPQARAVRPSNCWACALSGWRAASLRAWGSNSSGKSALMRARPAPSAAAGSASGNCAIRARASACCKVTGSLKRKWRAFRPAISCLTVRTLRNQASRPRTGSDQAHHKSARRRCRYTRPRGKPVSQSSAEPCRARCWRRGRS